jgi:hypothetical protein
MTDRAGDAFVIERGERRLLPLALLDERAGKERDRRVAGFAVSRRLDAAGAEQDVGAFAIERLARGVAMERFGPGVVRVGVAFGATRSGKELFNGNQLCPT